MIHKCFVNEKCYGNREKKREEKQDRKTTRIEISVLHTTRRLLNARQNEQFMMASGGEGVERTIWFIDIYVYLLVYVRKMVAVLSIQCLAKVHIVLRQWNLVVRLSTMKLTKLWTSFVQATKSMSMFVFKEEKTITRYQIPINQIPISQSPIHPYLL